MPHVDDQFAGHVLPGDPRSLLTGAFGCTWPTMPAYRYNLVSTDATGLWAGFNGKGALLELTTPIADHNTPRWELIGSQPPFDFVRWRKLPTSDEFSGTVWQLWWKRLGDPLNLLFHLPFAYGRCNVDVKLPDWSAGPSFPGSAGSTFRAAQVLYDETAPPS